MPHSSFLKEDVTQLQAYWEKSVLRYGEEFEACGDSGTMDRVRAEAIRRCKANVYYRSSAYRDLRDRYEVSIESHTIGGVPIEVFVPEGGSVPTNEHRVLINLHGGGFTVGSRTISHLKSIPIASVATIKVSSIDYRIAPQDHFPAASEHVASVYAQLIKSHVPRNIRIYGAPPSVC